MTDKQISKVYNRAVVWEKAGFLTSIGFITLAALLPGFAFAKTGGEKPDAFQPEKVKSLLQPLDLTREYHPPRAIENYFDYYKINLNNVHCFGSFESHGFSLAAHVFYPADAAGTVFILHGYFDHTGVMGHLIRFCLENKYSVVIFDLPGHGLSSGERFSIDDFSLYADVFGDVTNLVEPHCARPFSFIGQSMGCAVFYEYLHRTGDKRFDKVVFLAPLIHSAHWKLSKTGYRLVRPFTSRLPRKIRRNSSDKKFSQKVRTDPLQSKKVIPVKFLTALYDWDHRIADYPDLAGPVFIIQGTGDVVVDWRYNLEFLKNKVRPVIIKKIPGANHQLVNERKDLRNAIFELIKAYLF